MTRKLWIMAAAGGSAALLLGAFGFQYLGGLLPCTLCLWQRWPHAAAVAIGALGLALPQRIWPILGALAALTTAAIALFHVGVEQFWWDGLATCTANSMAGVSVDDLLSLDTQVAAPVRCDAIPWQFMGLSMAGWNGVLSLGLAAAWVQAARQT
ncbi:MAG: disulfide bond formation protein B [Cypionkella sp.]|nr:disulfide bond formation protein B [Cypionkella sp.]